MPYSSSFNIGAVRAGEQCIDFYPKYPNPAPVPGIVLVHGAGSNADYCLAPYGNQGTLTSKMIGAGFPGISTDNGGQQTWGNSTSMSGMASGMARLKGRPDAHSTNYSLVGASMGGLISLNYAASAIVKPRCIVMTIPVININDIVSNNRAGYASIINSAYGGTYNEASVGASYNPYTMRSASKLLGIPMLIFYGLTDSLCLPSFTEGFAAADPTKRTLVPLQSGHDENSYKSVDQAMVVDFLKTYNV